MKTNKFFKYTSFLFLSAAVLTACGDFEEINTNKQGVSTQMAKGDGVSVGGFIQTLQRTVIPIGTAANSTDYINRYQTAYHLGQDTWSGYFAQNADWNSGRNHTTYYLMNGWIKDTYDRSYTDVFNPWLSIKNKATADTPQDFALAQVLKIAAWHKTTDVFGPIPYTKAGMGLIVTPYDSQEVVYKTMLQELAEAVTTLTTFANNGGKLFTNYDLVYGGDAVRWVKFANSLMLRLAMRIRYALPQEAQRYAELAVNHSIGVMSDVKDGASISLAQGLQFENPIERFAGQYGETRMGLPIFSYMAGYEDPRLPKYFLPSQSSYAIPLSFTSNSYLPLPPGLGVKGDEKNIRSIFYCSLPNIERNTPIHWMRTSEVLFLRAEGALVGWNMKADAEVLYKQGIAMSFAENQVPEAALAQYINTERQPTSVQFNIYPYRKNYQPASQASVSFKGNQEEKLEKIMIQKWIALYPNGQEAWSEWRRTGYPRMQTVYRNNSNGLIDSEKGIRRMHYTIRESRSDEERKALEEAVQLLGGPDEPSTKLWWDKKH